MAVIDPINALPGTQGAGMKPTAEGNPAGYGMRIARGRYDFAADGGAVGTINLLPAGLELPANAVVLGGFIDVVTPPTSGGAATVALQVEGAGDLQAAAAVTGAPWSTTGRKSVVPAFTGATSVRTTAARNIAAVVAVAALTAGVFDVYLFYIVVA